MKRVLIIEDDPIVSHIYRSRLEKAGFEVDVATDGQTGYYRVIETCPDALLLDLMLPRINGIELLKKIRTLPQFEKLPVIVFTNAFVGSMIHNAFFSGASVVYNKSSVTPRQIIDALNTAFSKTNSSTVPAVPRREAAPAIPARTSIPTVSSEDDEETFESALLKTFLQNAAASIVELRKLLQGVGKASGEAARDEQLEQLCRKTRAFSANAGMAKLQTIATVGSATEALLKEVFDRPDTASASALRTVASAIDLVEDLAQDLVQSGAHRDLANAGAIRILVVDGDAPSRNAISSALAWDVLDLATPENPDQAISVVKEREFDLIALDLDTTGGFKLCDKIREGSAAKTTPVLFVTGAMDFQIKSNATLHSPSDLIAKPYMPMELTVKVIIMALRHRIQQFERKAAAAALQKAPVPH